MIELTAEEIRVVGCLLEKEATTPDNYPLTVNSLTAACNQSTNRYPVVRFGEGEITAALTHLRELGLTRIVYSPSNRAPKHRHVLPDVLRLDPDEIAVLCVLMLRGAQTIGEIKGRTERMHTFADLAAVESVLDRLAARGEPLTARLPRRPGQKDARYVHLLGGPVDVEALADDFGEGDHAGLPGVPGSGGSGAAARAGRLDAVDERVAALEAHVAELDAQIARMAGVVERLRPLIDD